MSLSWRYQLSCAWSWQQVVLGKEAATFFSEVRTMQTLPSLLLQGTGGGCLCLQAFPDCFPHLWLCPLPSPGSAYLYAVVLGHPPPLHLISATCLYLE